MDHNIRSTRTRSTVVAAASSEPEVAEEEDWEALVPLLDFEGVEAAPHEDEGVSACFSPESA
jgi:hypothetical protein